MQYFCFHASGQGRWGLRQTARIIAPLECWSKTGRHHRQGRLCSLGSRRLGRGLVAQAGGCCGHARGRGHRLARHRRLGDRAVSQMAAPGNDSIEGQLVRLASNVVGFVAVAWILIAKADSFGVPTARKPRRGSEPRERAAWPSAGREAAVHAKFLHACRSSRCRMFRSGFAGRRCSTM